MSSQCERLDFSGDKPTTPRREINRLIDDLQQHAVGYKADVGKNRLTLIMHGFARALLEVGKVGTFGAQKYTDDGWCEVDNAEQRYTDALYRHLLAEATNKSFDEESGLLHAAHSAWNALARLELQLRNSEQ